MNCTTSSIEKLGNHIFNVHVKQFFLSTQTHNRCVFRNAAWLRRLMLILCGLSWLQNLLHRLHWRPGGPVSTQHRRQSQPVVLSRAGELLHSWDRPHLGHLSPGRSSDLVLRISSAITLSHLFPNTVWPGSLTAPATAKLASHACWRSARWVSNIQVMTGPLGQPHSVSTKPQRLTLQLAVCVCVLSACCLVLL